MFWRVVSVLGVEEGEGVSCRTQDVDVFREHLFMLVIVWCRPIGVINQRNMFAFVDLRLRVIRGSDCLQCHLH